MKKIKDTKLGAFLKENVPEALEFVGDFIPNSGTIGVVKNVISRLVVDKEKRDSIINELSASQMEFEKDMFALEVEDRKRATKMYLSDSIIQKIFALVFLFGYAFLCWYMLEILRGTSKESELFKTMVTMIFTSTSTKLGTIIDFLYGASTDKSTK